MATSAEYTFTQAVQKAEGIRQAAKAAAFCDVGIPAGRAADDLRHRAQVRWRSRIAVRWRLGGLGGAELGGLVGMPEGEGGGFLGGFGGAG
jgi:hypothetical protein